MGRAIGESEIPLIIIPVMKLNEKLAFEKRTGFAYDEIHAE
jgi:hypothetical protein